MTTYNRDLKGVGDNLQLGVGGNKLENTSDGIKITDASCGLTNLHVKDGVSVNHAITKGQLDNLVDGAGTSLDQLSELAAAINNDPNFNTTMLSSLALKATKLNPEFEGELGFSHGHIRVRADVGNDMMVTLAGQEALQVTRQATAPHNTRFVAGGGTKSFQFMQPLLNTELEGSTIVAGTLDATGIISAPEIHSDGGHLRLKASTGNDLLVTLAGQETLQATRHTSSGNCVLTSGGGAKDFEFASPVTFNGVVTGIASSEVGLGNCDNTSDADKPVSTAGAAANTVIQNDVDSNEAASIASLALKSNAAHGTHTGTTVMAALDCSGDISSLEYNSAGGHLKFRTVTNDATFYLNDAEQYQISRHSSGDTAYTSGGGSKGHRFNGVVDLIGGFKVGSAAITADATEINYLDGVTSAIQTQFTNQQADIDGNESDSDSAIALKANIASPTFTGTVGGITKSMVGLGNCDNTSDADKPVSTAGAAANAALQADIDQNETDADAAIAANTAAISSNDTDIAANTAAIVSNDTDIAANTSAVALKADAADARFTGNTGIGTTSPDGDTVCTVHGEGKYGANSVLAVQDSSATAAGVGGGIALMGIRDVAGNQTLFGSIKATKENASAGQFGASVEIGTRANGSGDVETGFTVNPDQSCTTAGGVTVGEEVALTDVSGDPSAVSGFSHLYSKSGEAYVQDQSGNATKISPHNGEGEWEYFSRNTISGACVRVNMMDLIKKVEQLSGEQFIYEE